jgi:putative DNA primase/helicase
MIQTNPQVDKSDGLPPRPSAPPVNAAGIPAELTERPQWVAWNYEPRKGKWTKAPVNVRTGGHASTTDLMTWVTFAKAIAYYHAGNCDGIGFVFCSGDPFAGVDLDHCRDAQTGEVAPWAAEIIAELGGYAEVSPSGTGVKVWTRGKVRGDGCRKPYGGGEVELYSQERYFTVTGQRLEGQRP